LLTWNKGLFFENICTSLENEGYEIWPFIIPSASCGAWDKRERVWIIAYNHKFRCNNEQEKQREVISNEIRDNAIEKQNRGKQQCGIMQSDFIPADITEQRIGELSIQQRGQNETGHADVDGEIKINPDINKFNSDNAGYNSGTISQQQTSGIQINNDINGKGLQGHTWYELTKGQKDTIRRNGQANWLRDWIEVASELCRSNARVPHRMDRIKALGNSVNPYVVYQIFKAIEQYENSLKTE
jgi:site-specific DNA-cytosine methylase